MINNTDVTRKAIIEFFENEHKCLVNLEDIKMGVDLRNSWDLLFKYQGNGTELLELFEKLLMSGECESSTFEEYLGDNDIPFKKLPSDILTVELIQEIVEQGEYNYYYDGDCSEVHSVRVIEEWEEYQHYEFLVGFATKETKLIASAEEYEVDYISSYEEGDSIFRLYQIYGYDSEYLITKKDKLADGFEYIEQDEWSMEQIQEKFSIFEVEIKE